MIFLTLRNLFKKENDKSTKYSTSSLKKDCTIIGIMGVEEGVGSTHTSIMFANYVGRKVKKIALVEWGRQEAFEKIEKVYEGRGFREYDEKFKINKVEYFKNYSESGFAGFRRENYDVVVVDFGKQSGKKIKAITEVDKIFIVGRSNEWRIHEIIEFNETYEEIPCTYVVPFAESMEMKLLKKQTGKEVFSVYHQKDPFVDKADNNEIFEIMMGI